MLPQMKVYSAQHLLDIIGTYNSCMMLNDNQLTIEGDIMKWLDQLDLPINNFKKVDFIDITRGRIYILNYVMLPLDIAAYHALDNSGNYINSQTG